jgi:DNA-binding MarR family transcriptional regulator
MARAAAPPAPPGTPSDVQLVDALKAVIGCLHAALEEVVAPLGLPAPHAVALRRIDGALSMKELGQQLRCDASFVTAIADSLEERGLVRREIDQQDRRIKNLVLTGEGAALRAQLEESFHSLPGLRILSAEERTTLFRLLVKMREAAEERGG